MTDTTTADITYTDDGQITLTWAEDTETRAATDELTGFDTAISWLAEHAGTRGAPVIARVSLPGRLWLVTVDPEGGYQVLDPSRPEPPAPVPVVAQSQPTPVRATHTDTEVTW